MKKSFFGASLIFLLMMFLEMYTIADNGVKTKDEIIEVQGVMPEVRYNQPRIKNTRVQVELEVNEQKIKEEAEAKAKAEAEEQKRKEKAAARRKAQKVAAIIQKKKELKNLKKFYYELNTKDTDMTNRIGLSRNTYEKILKILPYDYVGFFEKNSAYIWEISQKRNLNEFLIVGIIANESCWAQDPVAKNNFSSQRIGNSNSYYEYATAEKGIQVLADSLSTNYLNPKGKYYNGTSLQKINELYCEPLVREDGSVEKYGWAEDTAICIKMVIREYLKTLE